MTAIITADLHVDDNPKNADRWNLFPWLDKQVTKTGAKHLLLLGDITEAKDRHSSKLVNKLVKALSALAQRTQVLWLRGNHDGLDQSSPFFEFMNLIEGDFIYINEPMELAIDDGIVEGSRNNKPSLFLPSTRDYKQAWKGINFDTGEGLGGGATKGAIKYIFMHQTFDGALAENGTELRGIPPSLFADTRAQIISGDIHVPQAVNDHITYVGSPYRIHFGDTFTARVLLLRKGEFIDLHFPAKGREVITARTLTDLEKQEHDLGTQVKIRLRLKRQEYPEWPSLRKDIMALASRRGWEVCGLELLPLKTKDKKPEDDELVSTTPEDVLTEYANRKKLNKGLVEAGVRFLKEAQNASG